ncbi:MAG: hydrolase [Gammaproteobacteria bacterium]|nr:hydrolase [Gammaproteobacteria bacterium]
MARHKRKRFGAILILIALVVGWKVVGHREGGGGFLRDLIANRGGERGGLRDIVARRNSNDGLVRASAENSRNNGDSGHETRTFSVGGEQRKALLVVPESHGQKLPLLLVFHGGKGSGENLERQTGFSELAESEGFLVAYPDSQGNWSDGRSTTGSGRNDIDFVRAILADLRERGLLDETRVYAAGISNGGMFVLRLACEMSGEFAAFAAVSASIPEAYRNRCAPAGPVHLLMINGREDPLVRWSGGEIPRGEGGRVISVPETADFWKRQNGCGAAQRTMLPDRDPQDGTRVEQYSYTGCVAGGDLTQLVIDGGGHGWPGGMQAPGRFRERIAGRSSRDIEGRAVVWNYLRRWNRARP